MSLNLAQRLVEWSERMDELGMNSLADELEELANEVHDVTNILQVYEHGLGLKIHDEKHGAVDVEFTNVPRLLDAIGRERVAQWLMGNNDS